MSYPTREEIQTAALPLMKAQQLRLGFYVTDDIVAELAKQFGVDLNEKIETGRSKFGNLFDWVTARMTSTGQHVKIKPKHYRLVLFPSVTDQRDAKVDHKTAPSKNDLLLKLAQQIDTMAQNMAQINETFRQLQKAA
jgi:hypothetical protein